MKRRMSDSERHAYILDSHPGLEEALKTDHRIVRDIASRFNELLQPISEKQIQLVFKLQSDVKERAEKRAADFAAGKTVAAPAGESRVRVEGVVVSMKRHESQFGVCMKMTVKATTESGATWMTWGTVPSAISTVKVGDTVEFEAKLEASPSDPSFSFFRRPTKARIVNVEPEESASARYLERMRKLAEETYGT